MVVQMIAGHLVAVLGAALALFGDARKDGKLTALGWIALFLLGIGLINSATLDWESVQATRAEERRAILLSEIDEEWSSFEESELESVSFFFLRPSEVPVGDLFEGFESFRLLLETGIEGADGDNVARELTIAKVGENQHPESSHALVVTTEDGHTLSEPDSITLFRSRAQPKTPPQPPTMTAAAETVASQPPNRISDGSAVSLEGVVVGGLHVIYPDQTYSTGWGEYWLRPDAMVGGLRTSIDWQRLSLGDRHSSLRELRGLSSIELRLPRNVDLERVHDFSISFLAVSGAARFDLRGLLYYKTAYGTWEVGMDAHDFYSLLKKSYFSDRLATLERK